MDFSVYSGVADPDLNPDLSDPFVFEPPGSGSGPISQRYGFGFGSGSFYHQAKMAKIAGSGSGSIRQRHGSVDPDPHQNVMEQQHWFTVNTI
jgi:hypothetical protein